MLALIARWLVRLFCWDGVLPVIIWASPGLLLTLFPNDRGPIEIFAIFAPTVGVIARFYVGRKTIRANHCPPLVQSVQIACLCLGILLLFFLDAFMILMHLMPAQGFGEEWHIFAMLFTAYFSLMALAMFPGRPYEGVERGRE